MIDTSMPRARKRLAGHLAEAAEADHQHAAGQPVGDLDAVHRFGASGGSMRFSRIGASGVSAIDRITAAVSSAAGVGAEQADARAPW